MNYVDMNLIHFNHAEIQMLQNGCTLKRPSTASHYEHQL